jgi:hypothetical protein
LSPKAGIGYLRRKMERCKYCSSFINPQKGSRIIWHKKILGISIIKSEIAESKRVSANGVKFGQYWIGSKLLNKFWRKMVYVLTYNAPIEYLSETVGQYNERTKWKSGK